jgi:hypothetical protein
MPDDFQAQLPPPNRPPAHEDRYAEVNFRKPEEETSGWRTIALLVAGLVALLALGLLKSY